MMKVNILNDYTPVEFTETLNHLSIQSKRNFKILALLFVTGFGIMAYILYSFPILGEEEKKSILQFPRTPEALQDFVRAISKYNESHFYHVLTLFVWIYLL